ncbi:MAG: hypothetical protein P8X95_10640, partial [Anaerolineales bacterium]
GLVHLLGLDHERSEEEYRLMLGQEELSHLLFPLGDYTKDKVRAISLKRRLPVAEKAESQELCIEAGGAWGRYHERSRLSVDGVLDVLQIGGSPRRGLLCWR